MRRRALMAAQEKYVTDGLILWLDGYDASSSLWTDKVGGREFTLVNCIVLQNGVVFNGTSAYGICHDDAFGGQTIEVAIRDNATTNWAPIFAQQSIATKQNIILYLNNTGTIATRATDTVVPQRSYARQSIASISALQDGTYALVNGNEAKGTTADLRQFSRTGELVLGKRQSDSTVYFNGTIHAIRVYNRKLSKAEMLNNQRLDNSRFNLNIF